MNDSPLKSLNTADRVVAVLGGPAAASAVAQCSIPQVYNELARGTFSPASFLLMTQALAELGYRAPAALWRIKQPRRARGFQGGNHAR